MSDQPDKLIVTGFGALDGEYPFDLIALMSEGHPDALTYREWHRIKTVSGVRAGEFIDAWDAGDLSLQMAVATIVLARRGKNVSEADMWDAPGTSTLRFVIDIDARTEGDDDDVPPPPEPLATEATGSSERSGGESSRATSGSPETAPSPIGVLGTAISGRVTSPA